MIIPFQKERKKRHIHTFSRKKIFKNEYEALCMLIKYLEVKDIFISNIFYIYIMVSFSYKPK